MLVVSTDPAHSLRDVLGNGFSPRSARRPPSLKLRRTAVALAEAGQPSVRRSPKGSRSALRAVELDAKRAFARWMATNRRALGDILEQGTWLDRSDVEALLDLSIPGLDELAGLLEISRLSDAGGADIIVVDTAPTGHTLRLFAAPETVGAVAEVLDALHAKHRLIRDQLARVGRPEASDRLIALLAEQAEALAKRLRDRRQTVIVWVSIAEELAVRETVDALAALTRAGLEVDEIVVNRVIPAGPACRLCDARRTLERRAIGDLRRLAGRRPVRVIEETPQEPRGGTALARLARALTAQRAAASLKSQVSSAKAANFKLRPSNFTLETSDFKRDASDLDALLGAKLVFFGGKGGVGKTTVAAATALRIAAAHPDRRVLVMSTDPAHSLGDAFDAMLGDAPSAVRGAPANLRVRELDAARALAVRRAALASALDELGDAFDTGVDGARASDLLDLAPPGVDELFGMLSVFAAGADFDRIVVDTAPTGHALRLLEMPQIVHEWVQLLMRVLLKYKAVAAPGALGAELVELARAIRELRQLLADARQTRFIVVTRMADVPAAETTRLLRSLRRLHITVPAIVANAMTLAPGRCPRCRRRAAGERRRLAAMRRRARSAVILTPLTAPPPRGVGALRQWGASWING